MARDEFVYAPYGSLQTLSLKSFESLEIYLIECLIVLKGKFLRVEGLEPPHITAPEPKSGVSTNFTTLATGYESQFFNRRRDVKEIW